MICQIDTVTPFADYGPVWLLVGFLLLAVGYGGWRLLRNQERVADAQVRSLEAAKDKFDVMETHSTDTRRVAHLANDKLDAHGRLFESGLAALKEWANETDSSLAKRHVEQMERQLRNDLDRINQ